MIWILYAGLVWAPALAGMDIAVMIVLIQTVPLEQPWSVVSLVILIIVGVVMVALAVRSHMRGSLWDHVWFSAVLMVICSGEAVWEFVTGETEFPLASVYLALAFSAASNLILWWAPRFIRDQQKVASVLPALIPDGQEPAE